MKAKSTTLFLCAYPIGTPNNIIPMVYNRQILHENCSPSAALASHPKLCASAQSFFIFPQQQKKRNNYPTPALPFAYNPPTIYIDGI